MDTTPLGLHKGEMAMSTSLRTRFATIFAILIIALTILLTMNIGQRASQEISDEIGNSLSEVAFQISNMLDQYMWSRYGEISLLTELDILKNGEDPEAIQLLLNRLQSSFPSFSWIGYLDREGRVMAATGGILVGEDISARPVYQEGLKGIFIGDVHDAVLLAQLLPNPSGEPMKFVDISLAVRNQEGQVTGVLASHLSWEWAREIEASLLKPLQDRKDIEVFVVSATDDTVLLGSDDMIGHPLTLNSLYRARAGENHWQLEIWPDGQEYLTGFVAADGYMNYPGLDWVVLVRQPSGIAYAPVRNLQLYILVVGVALAAIFALVGWFMGGVVGNPLEEIARAADKLRAGEKTLIPQHKGIREIEVLENSLRQMIYSLTQTESALGVMEVIAQHDPLTGLSNRLALNDYLVKAEEAAFITGGSLTFLYLDLDGFKQVNDAMGHSAGDRLLKEVAQRLKDTVREGEMVARLGGDEFVMVLQTPGQEPQKIGEAVAHRVIEALNKPIHLDDQEARVGCSIGGAIWPLNGEKASDVLQMADKALYEAKKSGKNRVMFVKMQDEGN